MKRRRQGGAAEALEDNSGLIDLAKIGAVDALGDPVSGLQRRAAVGRLDAPAMPQLKPKRSINWVAIAVVLTGAGLAMLTVVGALAMREMGLNAAPDEPVVVAAPAPSAASAATPTPTPTPSTPQPAAPTQRAAATPTPASTGTGTAEAPGGDEPQARDGEPTVAPDEPAKPEKADRKERKRRRAKKLPAKPNRAAILSGMARVTPRIRACARGQGGVARLEMVIDGPRGKVRSVTASGVPASMKACVTRAAKRARFKPFADEAFRVGYPLKL
jgi:hypothetical protein